MGKECAWFIGTGKCFANGNANGKLYFTRDILEANCVPQSLDPPAKPLEKPAPKAAKPRAKPSTKSAAKPAAQMAAKPAAKPRGQGGKGTVTCGMFPLGCEDTVACSRLHYKGGRACKCSAVKLFPYVCHMQN